MIGVRGVLEGRTIRLEEAPNLPDGTVVEIFIRRRDHEEDHAPSLLDLAGVVDGEPGDSRRVDEVVYGRKT